MRGKVERLGVGEVEHLCTKEEALVGVPTKERKEYGASHEGCWCFRRSGYKILECYTGTTTGGTILPAAPWRGASSAKCKRYVEVVKDTMAPKQAKTTSISTEDKDMQEAVATRTKDRQSHGVWEQDTDDSDF